MVAACKGKDLDVLLLPLLHSHFFPLSLSLHCSSYYWKKNMTGEKAALFGNYNKEGMDMSDFRSGAGG